MPVDGVEDLLKTGRHGYAGRLHRKIESEGRSQGVECGNILGAQCLGEGIAQGRTGSEGRGGDGSSLAAGGRSLRTTSAPVKSLLPLP